MSSRRKSSSSDAPRSRGLPSHLSVLCRMLRSPDEERRLAAAMVLAEIAPRETLIVEALGELLAEENPRLTPHALHALERIGSRAGLPFLLPLLDGETSIRVRAQRAIAALGEPALADVCRELAQAPKERRRPLINLLVDLDGKGALTTVLDALLYEEPAYVSSIVQAYQRRWAGRTPEEREDRSRIVLKFLERDDVRERNYPTAMTLRILGALAAPSTRRLVLSYIRAKHSDVVRVAALQALHWLGPPTGKEAPAFLEFLALLEDSDATRLAPAVLEALATLPPPVGSANRLKKLLSHPSAPVRTFAIERLGDLKEAVAVRALLQTMLAGAPDLRELAHDALRRSPGAPAHLVKALIATESDEEAWVLSRLAASRGEELGKAQVTALRDSAQRLARSHTERAEAILHALRPVDPALHRKLVLARGIHFFKKGKMAETVQALEQLDLGTEDVPEGRYALLVALLKTTAKDLTEASREGSRSLGLVRGLLTEKDFPLAKRLIAEKALGPDDLFYLGFHFVGADGAQYNLGSQMLRRVMKIGPRTKLGMSAKKKLAEVEGIGRNRG